jgi:hypothetical protein
VASGASANSSRRATPKSGVSFCFLSGRFALQTAMDVFYIIGLTIGGAGFVMAAGAWNQLGKVQKKIESLRKEIEELKKAARS